MTASRRTFIATGGSLLLAGVAQALPTHRRRTSRDAADTVVLRGGTVIDGSGDEARVADVAVQEGRITAIGLNLGGRFDGEIDVRGLIVAPGFIDIHSHGDATLAADPRAESVIRQGITTIAVGADGSSRASGAPGDDFHALQLRLDQLRPAPNVASMIGLGTVRGTVVGNTNRAASPAEVRRMVTMVERAVAQGACGASSGLEYTPGAFATLVELVALCTPLARRGLVYATHLRNEDDRLLEAIDEAIAVARGAGCALQISHLKTQGPRNWSRLQPAFDRITAARDSGINVAFDRYPYLAYATTLANLFPVWSRSGGMPAFFRRLRDPAIAACIETEARAKVELIGGWDNIQITGVRSARDRDAAGKRLGTWARDIGKPPYTALLELMQRSDGAVDMAGFAMSEENLERILAHPLGMICTDGSAFAIDGPTRRGSPHPRGAGSFPRVLGRYVRERGVLTLPDAIRRMTAMPADRLRLSDRGRLATGKAADIVVLDAATIADRATFEQPFRYATGITLVMVNGQVTLRDGTRSRTHAGRALQASPA